MIYNMDIEALDLDGGFKPGEIAVLYSGHQTGKSVFNPCNEIPLPTRPMKKFVIDKRYNMIVPQWYCYDEMLEWANAHPSLYTTHATGIVYNGEKALSFFLLRWA